MPSSSSPQESNLVSLHDAAEEPVAKPSLPDLFTTEEDGLLRYAFGIVGRRALAEEIVQDAFLKLHQQYESVQDPRG